MQKGYHTVSVLPASPGRKDLRSLRPLGTGYAFGKTRMYLIQYAAIVSTFGNLNPALAIPAGALYEIPDFKIEAIVELTIGNHSFHGFTILRIQNASSTWSKGIFLTQAYCHNKTKRHLFNRPVITLTPLVYVRDTRPMGCNPSSGAELQRTTVAAGMGQYAHPRRDDRWGGEMQDTCQTPIV